MADACGSDGFYSRIAIDEGATPAFGNFTSGSECWPLANACSLVRKVPKGNYSGLNGSREEDSEMTRDLNHQVAGDIPLYASPDSLRAWVPRIFGGDFDVSNDAVPTTALPDPFHVIVHKDAYIYPYYKLQVAVGEISGEVNNPLMLNLSCLGVSRDSLQAAANWPAGLNPSRSTPFMFEDCVLTLGGTAYKMRKFSLKRDNRLSARFWGTNTACGIKADGPALNTLQLVLPHSTDTIPTILAATQDDEYIEAVITGTHPDAAFSFEITIPGLQLPEEDPPVVAGEIILDLTSGFRRVAGAAPITFNVDNVS